MNPPKYKTKRERKKKKEWKKNEYCNIKDGREYLGNRTEDGKHKY